MKTVKMTYSDFCWLKENGNSLSALKTIVCEHLHCQPDDIDHIDFNFSLTVYVYFKQEVLE